MIVFLSGGITDTNQEARPLADPQDYADPVRGTTAFDQGKLTRRRHNPEFGISRRSCTTNTEGGFRVEAEGSVGDAVLVMKVGPSKPPCRGGFKPLCAAAFKT